MRESVLLSCFSCTKARLVRGLFLLARFDLVQHCLVMRQRANVAGVGVCWANLLFWHISSFALDLRDVLGGAGIDLGRQAACDSGHAVARLTFCFD